MWTNLQIENAIKAVLDSTAISISAAARDHGFPITTQKHRLPGRVLHGTKPGPVSYLSCSEDEKLAVYLLDANKVGHGKTRLRVKIIAETVTIEKVFSMVLRLEMGGGIVFYNVTLNSL